MNLRLPVCARLVRTQLFKYPDPICQLDDTKGSSFWRFASSVPGPLENRRRLGKRRLTQLSDTFTPTYPDALWSFITDGGVFKWDWQAPTNRAEKQDDTSSTLIPSWLLELGSRPEEDENDLCVNVDDIYETKPMANGQIVEGDIQHLRGSIQSASRPQELHQLLQAFLPSMKQHISLGLVSADILGSLLLDVTRDLQIASAQWNVCPSTSLFMFYTSCWEGIESCRVMGPMEFGGETMDSFLSMLACLPFDEMVQNLATRVVLATPASQHLEMEQGIKAIVLAWSCSFLSKEHVGDCQADITTVETAIPGIETCLNTAHACILSTDENSYSEVVILRVKETLSSIQSSLLLAKEAIRRAESALSPKKASAKKLAAALDVLQPALLSNIILSCSENITLLPVGQENDIAALRYYWLSTVSYASNVNDELFLQTWKQMEIHAMPFNEIQCCHLVLGHWNSQGLVWRPFEVETFFASSNLQDLASLLFSLDRYKQHFLRRTRDLFLLLEALGKLNLIYVLLTRLRTLGLKLPITQLRLLIESFSKYDVNLALKVYGLHLDLNLDRRLFRTHFLHDFINTVINDPTVSPNRLWRHLKIPMHESRPLHERNLTPKPLSKQNVELLNTIAVAFAQCETRSTRVALRNVLQCLYHFRLNNVPITQQLSVAISQIGISREIRENKLVGQDRLQYVISIIEEVEGKRVAHLVDEMVFRWRNHLKAQSVARRRERNVLRVGPID